MSTDDFGQILRLINLVTSLLVLLILLAASVYRWRTMDSVERLFCLGLIAAFLYLAAVTRQGIIKESPFYWYTPIITVGNIWLIGAIIILTLRPVKIAPHLLPHHEDTSGES